MTMPSNRTARGARLVAACAMALSVPRLAIAQQAFPIAPPKLPPRAAAGAAPSTAPQPQRPPAQMQQPSAQPYAQQQPHAAQPYGAQPYAPQPQAAPAQPSPRAAAGPCRVLPSAERQALALVSGDPPLPREHVALGEFRAQQVVHSGDGRWAVAFTKLRGAPQFAALTIDLTRCSVQRTIELPAAGSDAQFDGDHATLRYAGGEQRVPLADGSVR